MKKRLIPVLKYTAFIAIAVLIIWFSFKGLTPKDWAEIKNALSNANYWVALPVFIVLLLSHSARAARWKQLIQPLGYKPRFINLLGGLLICYLGNAALPRLGEILRCTSVSRYEKIPAEKLIGTIVAERAFDFCCFLLFICIAVATQFDVLGHYFHDVKTMLFTGSSTNKLLVIIGGVLLFILLIFLLRKLSQKDNFLSRIIKGIGQGLLSIKNVENKPKFIFYTLVIWFSYIGAAWLGCLALDETFNVGLGAAIAMLVSGTFGIMLTPGGIGAYPAAIQKTLLLYSIPAGIGLASGWIQWFASQFVFVIIFGVIAYIFLPIINRKKVVATSL